MYNSGMGLPMIDKVIGVVCDQDGKQVYTHPLDVRAIQLTTDIAKLKDFAPQEFHKPGYTYTVTSLFHDESESLKQTISLG